MKHAIESALGQGSLIRPLIPSFAIDGGVGGSSTPARRRRDAHIAAGRGARLPEVTRPGATGSTESGPTRKRTRAEEAFIGIFDSERADAIVQTVTDLSDFTDLLKRSNTFITAHPETTQLSRTMRFMDILSGRPNALQYPHTIMDDELVDAASTVSRIYLDPIELQEENIPRAVEKLILKGNILGRRAHEILMGAIASAARVDGELVAVEDTIRSITTNAEPLTDEAFITIALDLIDTIDELADSTPHATVPGDITALLRVEKDARATHAYILGSKKRPDLKAQHDAALEQAISDISDNDAADSHVQLYDQIAALADNDEDIVATHRGEERDQDNTKAAELEETLTGIIPKGKAVFQSLMQSTRTRSHVTAFTLYTTLRQLKQELMEKESEPMDRRVLAEDFIAAQASHLLTHVQTMDNLTGAEVRKLMEKPLRTQAKRARQQKRGTGPERHSVVEDAFRAAIGTTRDILTGRYTEGSGPEECADRLRSLEENEFFQRRARSVLGDLIPANDPTIIGPVGIALLSAIASGYSFSVSDIAAMQLVVDDFAAHSRGYRQRNVTAVQQENSDAYHAMLNSIEHTLDLRNVIERLAEIASSHSLMQDISEVMVGLGAEIGDSYRMQQRIHSELGNIVAYSGISQQKT